MSGALWRHGIEGKTMTAFIWQSNVTGQWYAVGKVNGAKQNIPCQNRAAAIAKVAEINGKAGR